VQTLTNPRTPAAGVLIFIVSCPALAIYSIDDIIKKWSDLHCPRKRFSRQSLAVLLTAAQNADGKEELAKFNDDPDTYLE